MEWHFLIYLDLCQHWHVFNKLSRPLSPDLCLGWFNWWWKANSILNAMEVISYVNFNVLIGRVLLGCHAMDLLFSIWLNTKIGLKFIRHLRVKYHLIFFYEVLIGRGDCLVYPIMLVDLSTNPRNWSSSLFKHRFRCSHAILLSFS